MAIRQNLKQADAIGPRDQATQDDALTDPKVRIATILDEPVPSPVQTLTSRLENELNEADLPARWPLAISAPIWIVTSGLLWFAIVKGVLTLLHH